MKFKGTKLSKRTVALLAAAVIMLGSGGVMSTRAIPQITADAPYDATLELNSLAVDITEQVNGGDVVTVSDGEFTLVNDEKFSIGKKYDDVISVVNSGDADEYVRVVVRKYWTDADGKRLDLDPGYIELKKDPAWTKVDGDNKEYSIYYLSDPLAIGASKELFTEFRINEEVKTKGKKIKIGDTEYDNDQDAADAATPGDIIKYSYTYDGCVFNVEAEAQAVQTHSSEKALRSVWGIDPGAVGITLVD